MPVAVAAVAARRRADGRRRRPTSRRRTSSSSRARWSARSTGADARRPAVRLRRRPGRGRPDAVHPRGDEAVQRAQVATWPASCAASWSRTPRRWSTASRSSSSSPSCRDPARAWSRTAARSPSASIRACRELGIESVAVYSTADRDSLGRAAGRPRRSASARRRRRELPADRARHRRRADDRLRRGPPGLRLPVREPRLRARLRRQRPGVRRAGAGDHGGHGRQGPRQGRDARRRAAAGARLDGPAGLRAGGARRSPRRPATRCC